VYIDVVSISHPSVLLSVLRDQLRLHIVTSYFSSLFRAQWYILMVNIITSVSKYGTPSDFCM
jgi:hypothetical protein